MIFRDPRRGTGWKEQGEVNVDAKAQSWDVVGRRSRSTWF
jgi:hypothetical protein